jgi:hypothetical protein
MGLMYLGDLVLANWEVDSLGESSLSRMILSGEIFGLINLDTGSDYLWKDYFI